MPGGSNLDDHLIKRLLIDAHNNSKQALGELLHLFEGRLKRYVRKHLDEALRSKCCVEDIVQQTFQAAVDGFAQFAGNERNFAAWLRGIAHNTIRRFHRKYLGSKRRSIYRERPLTPANGCDTTQILFPVQVKSPSEVAELNDLHQAILAAMEQLPDDQLQVVLLHNVNAQLSFPEIAVIMGRSVDACRSLWARAIENLRLQLRIKTWE